MVFPLFRLFTSYISLHPEKFGTLRRRLISGTETPPAGWYVDFSQWKSGGLIAGIISIGSEHGLDGSFRIDREGARNNSRLACGVYVGIREMLSGFADDIKQAAIKPPGTRILGTAQR
jgi:hypothetical protein